MTVVRALVCTILVACTQYMPAPRGATAPKPCAPADLHPGSGEPQPPSVILFERNPWGNLVGADFPTMAIWDNGEVIYIHEVGSLAETHQFVIPPASAERVIEQVATLMRNVPPWTSVSEWTDQRTVEIAVRDGDTWHVAEVYGLSREGAARGGPAGFRQAYLELLALRPKAGLPFEPTDVEVVAWGFDYAKGDPIPWPSDVPAPPRDAEPGTKDGMPIDTRFVVPASDLPALRAMTARANASDPPRGIGFNGHKWTVALVPRFRGQRAIYRILRCANPRG